MQDRLRRIVATGLTTVELAGRLGISDQALLHWIDGDLSLESADVVEVALSLLELDLRRLTMGHSVHSTHVLQPACV